jgi:hypothetical protein
VIALTRTATADRDFFHGQGLAALAARDTGLAEYLFWAAGQFAPLSPRQRQEQAAVAFTSLPRAADVQAVLRPEAGEQ